jgi:hypothetical protein
MSITVQSLQPSEQGFTVDGITTVGSLNTVRTSRGRAVVWVCDTREVWVGESTCAGSKRAIIDALEDKAVVAKIRRLEASHTGITNVGVNIADVRRATVLRKIAPMQRAANAQRGVHGPAVVR